jgi:hypothetical protein
MGYQGMGYQGTSKSLKVIAEELGAGSVVEGSVQVVGGRLRLNVQLIDATTDAHLWAERYDRSLDDAFAIQSEVVQEIVTAVGAVLTRAEQGGPPAPTVSAEAYRLYLKGRDHEGRSGSGSRNLRTAEQFYERALTLDPNFSLAQSALAQVREKLNWYQYDNLSP